MTKRANYVPHAVLAVAVLMAASIGACTKAFPTRFPHQVHLAGLECGKDGKPECLNCNTCHTVSKADRTDKLPTSQVCTNCHKNDGQIVQAVLTTKPERTAGEIRFNHDQHLEMAEIQGQCVRCHGGVVKTGESTLPQMDRCFSCHEHEKQWLAGECAPCHSRENLVKTPPQTFLRHDQSFIRHHGTLSQQEKLLCQSCHTQQQCTDCHDVTQDLSIERRQPEKIERNFVHRGDFMVRHSIEAQEQPGRCVRCHTPSTCDECHVARGVSANRKGASSPHPVGWVGSNYSSRSFHGREARRDILQCASCHDQGPATNCIRCHKVGGFGGNPHPNGWNSLQSKSSTMCRYCHG